MPGTGATFIRDPQSAARLSRTFSRGLSAADLAEPLVSLDDTQPVEFGATLMKRRKLSILGVRCEGVVTGWVREGDLARGTLADCARPFTADEVLSESTSLDVVLCAFATAQQMFVEWRGEVAAVITRRDLQKAPVRMWLFGAITVLETNLTWAIETLYPNDSWQDRISEGRLEKARELFTERARCGSECRLVDCLQIKDKADILVSGRSYLKQLGLNSRREADRLMRGIVDLRNHLAHTQDLEQRHLATANQLASSIHTIMSAELAQQIVRLHRESGSDNSSTSETLDLSAR